MAIKVQGNIVIDDSKNIINIGVATIGSIDVNKISPDGSDFGTLNYVPIADGSGTWSWQPVTSAGAGILDGIIIKEEGSTVGTAGSITTLNFVGNNITATAVSGGAIATITASDTPTYNSLSVTGLSTFSDVVSIGATVGIGTRIDIIPYDTLSNGTLSFEGSQGQLFAITNNLSSGSIFSVNPISGIPIIDVLADRTIQLNPFGGNTGIGTTNPTAKLDVNGTLNVTGVSTFGGNVYLGDNDKAIFGDGGDLEIYHSGTDSVINDVGAGGLVLGGSTVSVRPSALNEFCAKFIANGAVELYYDNSKKFETTGAGIEITGTTDTDQLNVTGVSTFTSTVEITPSSDVKALVIDSTNATTDNNPQITLRGGGPNGIDFRDGANADGLKLVYRTSANQFKIENSENTTTHFLIDRDDGRVELSYGGDKKFETTDYGIYVTGAGNTSTIGGAANLVLDPSAVGDNTGTVTILGNLQVEGTQTIINSTTLEVDDKLVSIAKSATNASQADGAGLEINGASATLTYASTGDKWVFNKAPYYNTDRLLTTADEGTGSGLDADTVDGLEASQFLRSDANDVATGDITFRDNKLFFDNTTFSTFDWQNYQSDGGNLLWTVGSTGGPEMELESDGSNNTNSVLRVGGYKVWHAGNDGSGSGLDADTVDGLEASQFLRSDADDTTTGQIQITKANSTANGGGQIYLNGATGNRIDFNTNGVAAPTFTTRSAGTKIVLYPNVGATIVDYAFGIEGFTLWSSIPQATNQHQHRWYGGTTALADLKGSGELVIGSTSLTGTASQKLQVSGGAYVSGNLGIGATNPAAKLDVGGDINYNNNAIISNNGGTSNIDHLWHSDTASYGHGGVWHFVSDSTYKANGNSAIRAGAFANMADTGTASQKLQITGGAYVSGNLGVGATNPDSKLHLKTTSGGTDLLLQTAAGLDNSITFREDAKNYFRILHEGSAGSSPNNLFKIQTATSAGGINNDAITIKQSGDVGIGTDNPSELVHIRRDQNSGTYTQFQNSSTGSNSLVALKLTTNGGSSYLFRNSSTRTNDGGTNTTTLRNDAGDLRLQATGGYNTDLGIRVKATTGNVGIGTDSPVRPLHITSSDCRIRLEQIGETTDVELQNTNGNAVLTTNGASNILLQTNNTERLRITSTGNVGIGTDNPLSELHVLGRITGTNGTNNDANSTGDLNANFSTWIRIGDSLGAQTFTNGLGIKYFDSGNVHYSTGILGNKFYISNTSNNGNELFPSSRTDIIVANSSGDVGIGTDSPDYKLHVNSGTTNTALLLESTDTTVALSMLDNTTTTTDNYHLALLRSGDDTRLWSGNAEAIRIDSTQKVGINSTAPTARLDVNGDVSIASTVSIGTTIDIVPYNDLGALSFEGSAGQLFSITNNLISGSIFSVNDVSGIPSIDVDADGTVLIAPYGSTEYVGIGTTNPTAKLDVNGTLNVTGISTFGGNIYLGDNDKAIFGDGGDLEIFHDTSNSRIRDAGTGDLSLEGQNVIIKNAGSLASMADFTANSSVSLYFNGSKKFETTDYGIYITGAGNTSTIGGAANLVLDPSTVGDNTGTVTILGNLQVDGTQTIINSTTMTVDDLNITLASGAANASAANGAGLTVDGASATLTYASTGDKWVFNKSLDVTGNTDTDTLNVSGVSTFGGVIDIGTQRIQGGHSSYYIRVPNNVPAEFVSLRSIEIRADDDDSSDTEYLLLAAGQNELKVTSTAGAGTDANKLTYNGNIVWHAGNDGTGSGLDADTVDGIQASSFLRSDAADTASGVITFSNGNSVYGTGTALSAEFGVNTSAAGAIKLHGTSSGAYGLIQATTSNLHIDTVVGGTYLNFYDGSFISFGTGAGAESARFTGSTGTLTLGTTSATGTANQKLQVTGGAYVSGNLGVGATNPSYKLHIAGSGTINTGTTIARFTNSSNQNRIDIIDETASGSHPPGILSPAATYGLGLYAAGGPIRFYPASTSTEKIRIDNSGNLLINTTSATGTSSQPLQVTGGAYVSGNLGVGITNPGSTLAVGGTITELYNGSYWNVVTQADVGYGASQVPLNQYLGQLAFLDDYHPNGLRRDGGGSDDVVVGAGGSVGIGTDNPGYKLEVNGDIKVGELGTLWFSDASGSIEKITNTAGELNLYADGDINFYESDNNNLKFTVDVNNERLILGGDTNTYIHHPTSDTLAITNAGTESLRIDASNNVGIGTDNPTEKLDVSGTVKATTFTSTQTTGTAPFTVSSTTVVTNLNADTVDGIQASSFLRSDASDAGTGRIQFKANDSNNWDTIATATASQGGIEIYNNGAGNDAFMAFHAGGDYALYFGLDATTNDLSVGGWSMGANKYRVWHAGNDGTGSGLDADTVDGIQASSFLRSDAADTASGLITFSSGINVTNSAIGMGNDSAILYFNDGTNQTRSGYWTNKDGFEVRGDSNSKANVVLQTGNLEIDSNAYIGGILGVGGDFTVDGNLQVDGYQYRGDNVKTASLFVRGTGLNHNSNRHVYLNGTQIVNTSTRGLTLTVIGVGLTHVSSTNYDTYGSATNATNLATAIANINVGEIGVLSSYDAWELYVNDNLRAAALKVGLTKLGTYSGGGSRRPYSAVFYGTSDDVNGRPRDVIERMEEDDADSPEASIFCNLATETAAGSMSIPGAVSVNALYSSQSTTQGPVVVVDSANNVGIGTLTPAYKLEVNGSFAATTKSFVIDHPTKDGMKLRYGSLEGPENGVYVRGRLKGNNTIELPEHWTGLVDEDSITVNLTPIGRKAPLHSVVDIVDNTVVVESANDVVDCFYTVFGERKDVEKLEVEF